MLLDEFVQSAIVVDNIKKELSPLVDMLKKKDIRVDSFLYGQEELRTFKRNRQLIFIDLLLNENANQEVENMSLLIDALNTLCTNGFGLYGLVVWTKHPEFSDELKERIGRAAFGSISNGNATQRDEEEEVTTTIKIQPPLFIITLSKNKYIKAGYDYSSLPEDLEVELRKDPSAYFFVRWSLSVMKAKDAAVKGIYDMVNNYNEQNEKIPYLLHILAMNQTGTPTHYSNLTVDAYKAFDELLYSELTMQQRNETIPSFTEITNDPFGKEIASIQRISAKLNNLICIDEDGISQDLVAPGNVYKLKDDNSPLRIDANMDYPDMIKDIDKTLIEYVAIELTPPCDFSQQKKVFSRLIGGIVFDVPEGAKPDSDKPKFKVGNIGDKGYDIYPIVIGNEKVKCMIIDFRYLMTVDEDELKNGLVYEIWFRAKPKLFSDVLQKFSSHAARLGLAKVDLLAIHEALRKREEKEKQRKAEQNTKKK
jgi:hypothetical protein